VEDYVQTMEKLTTDMRFTIYNICYKRILIIWIVTAFIILLSVLFSGKQVCTYMMNLFLIIFSMLRILSTLFSLLLGRGAICIWRGLADTQCVCYLFMHVG